MHVTAPNQGTILAAFDKLKRHEIVIVIGSKRKSTHTISSLNINSKNIINEQHIANEFNNYFISVGPTLAEKLPPTYLNPLEFVRCNANSMVIFHIDLNEVITVINSLKTVVLDMTAFQLH